MKWFELLREDFAIVKERDPATQNPIWILTLHTGFWAVAAYRIEHAIWGIGCHWIARFLSVISRWITGVEIHPAVKVGRRLFLDHGMGIVIGETAELGDDVSIYQGVTLGGTSWSQKKRHPTLGNNVIIGAGAKIIGAITLGDNVRVGSNAVVVKDVPEQTTMVGIPAKPTKSENLDLPSFESYAQSHDEKDPMMQLFNKLEARLAELETDNAALKKALLDKGNAK